MNRPSKEEIDRILDPKKIAEFINEDGQLNTEVDYESSNLEMYLKYDLWEEDNALIILCGIDPLWKDRDIDFDDYGFAKIKCTWFFGRPATYDVLPREDIYGWIKECKEEHTAFLRTNGLAPPEGPLDGFLERKWQKERNAILDNLDMFEELLSNRYFNIVWSIREHHARQLMKRRLLWKSGRHEDRNPPGYYIDWAASKGVEIPWLEWAISEGLLPARNTNATVENPDDSNPLSIFRSMNSLRFEEVTIKVDPEKFMLEITARGAKVRVAFSAIGIMKKNEMTITRSGEILLEMARGVYTLNKRDNSALKRLSEILRLAFQTSSTPVAKGKPNFKLTIPKDKEAKFNASRRTVQFNDNSAVAMDDADEFLRNSDDQYDPDNPMYSDHD